MGAGPVCRASRCIRARHALPRRVLPDQAIGTPLVRETVARGKEFDRATVQPAPPRPFAGTTTLTFSVPGSASSIALRRRRAADQRPGRTLRWMHRGYPEAPLLPHSAIRNLTGAYPPSTAGNPAHSDGRHLPAGPRNQRDGRHSRPHAPAHSRPAAHTRRNRPRMPCR